MTVRTMQMHTHNSVKLGNSPKIRIIAVAAKIIAAPAAATEPNQLFQKKLVLAEIIEAASFAADNCPGVRVSEDAVAAVAADEGITDETIYTPE